MDRVRGMNWSRDSLQAQPMHIYARSSRWDVGSTEALSGSSSRWSGVAIGAIVRACGRDRRGQERDDWLRRVSEHHTGRLRAMASAEVPSVDGFGHK